MDPLDDLLDGGRARKPRWLELAAELDATAVDKREKKPSLPEVDDTKRIHAPLKLVSTKKRARARKGR